ncbi:cytochrome P450 4V2-like [Haemaphysalis longicornis]
MGWFFLECIRLNEAVLSTTRWVSLLIIFVVITAYSSRWLRKWVLLRTMPGPGTDWFPPWFLLSQYWKYGKDLWKRDATTVAQMAINHAARIYEGKTFKFYVGMSPFVILHTHEASEVLLTSKKNLKKPFVYSFFNPWLGSRNMLTSEGHVRKSKARLFKAAFTTAYLKFSIGIFNRNSKIFAENIEAIARNSQEKAVDCFEMVHLCVMDNATQAILGEDLELQKKNNQQYAHGYPTMTWLLVARFLRPWDWFDSLYSVTSDGKVWKDTIQKIEAVHLTAIKKRALALKSQLAGINKISEMGEDNAHVLHAADSYLMSNLNCPDYTMQEAVYDTVSTTFAATDSSTAAICWAIYLLGLNPDKQTKLQKELDDAFGQGVEHEYTSGDLEKLPYLDCCFKEATRLCPPFPIFGRELTEDLVIDGHTVPAGTTCMVNLYTLHTNKAVYTDPEMFIPERFLPENSAKIPPFAFLPFSGGVHPCLGQKFGYAQSRVVLATVFSKYSVESTLPLEELSLGFEVSLRAKEKLNVKFRRRNL